MNTNHILAPLIIPNKKITRNPNSSINEVHQIFFSIETIKIIRESFHKKNGKQFININHNGIVTGVIITKSFIIEEGNIKSLPTEFLNLPIGTWMIECKVENNEVWKMINENQINGLSLEGIFQYDFVYESNDENDKIEIEKDKVLEINFDDISYQISKGNTYENLKQNSMFSEFEILKEWKSKFGYKFNIYSNDHFINKKPHFHFDNKQENLYCKIGFDGEIFEIKNNRKIPKNIQKT
jgi:hypothetical protein